MKCGSLRRERRAKSDHQSRSRVTLSGFRAESQREFQTFDLERSTFDHAAARVLPGRAQRERAVRPDAALADRIVQPWRLPVMRRIRKWNRSRRPRPQPGLQDLNRGAIDRKPIFHPLNRTVPCSTRPYGWILRGTVPGWRENGMRHVAPETRAGGFRESISRKEPNEDVRERNRMRTSSTFPRAACRKAIGDDSTVRDA